MQKVKISTIKSNSNNPRIIKDDKFKKLVKSIKEFPQMLELRPIVVNNDMVVLGGNMRLKACKEAGLKEVPIIKASELTAEQEKEFIVKDNIGFGEWDWDILANEWDSGKLNQWSLGVWENKEVETNEFKPVLFPTQSNHLVTKEDINKAENLIGNNFSKGVEKKYIQTMCSKCGHEFNVEQV